MSQDPQKAVGATVVESPQEDEAVSRSPATEDESGHTAGAVVVSSTQCKTVTCTFDWNIRDLRNTAKCDGQVYSVTAPPFCGGDRNSTEWVLSASVWPLNIIVGFKLKQGSASPVRIRHEFAVLIDGCELASKNSGEVAVQVEKGATKFLEFAHTYKNLFSIIPFLLKCKITFVYPSTTMEAISVEAAEGRMVEDMTSFFESAELCDVVLVAGERKVKAHRAILAARSKVFRAMFKKGTREAEARAVAIEGMEGDTLAELVGYIYTGKAGGLPANALELMAAADMYELQELKSICAEEVLSNISLENVVEVLILAMRHSAPTVVARALYFIKANFSQFNASGKLEQLRDHPDIMVKVCRAVGE